MMKTNLFKRAGMMFLCILLCLCNVFPAVAQELVEKIDIGEPEYFLVSGETETLTDSISQNGTYRVKVSVRNYSDSDTYSVLLIFGLFDKTTRELLDVKLVQNASVAFGTTPILTGDILVTDYTRQTLDCYLWQSATSLKPLGNTAPLAPRDVIVITDKITNSTVELSWTASEDDTDSISHYNVYRNGEFVGSTKGNVTTFRDVGIRHKTEVSYMVEAVDAAGAVSEKSEVSETVTTDDIARLWFGSAASVIPEGQTSKELQASDYDKIQGYNLNPVHLVVGDVNANDGKAYTTSIEAVNYSYCYEGTEELGLNALKFNPNLSRVLASIPEGDFLNAIKASDQEEIKFIMHYFDLRNATHTYPDSTGINRSHMIRYAYASQLNGTLGATAANGQRWLTGIYTVPTSNNRKEGYVSNSSSVYTDVFKDRDFQYTAISSAGTKTASTDGVDAMFGIGNSTGNNEAYISKVEIGMQDYVPYGAVLDFQQQEESQFVELLRRDGYNQGALVSKTAAASNETKLALELDSTNSKNRYMKLGMSSSYLTSSDRDVIIRITYLDDHSDELDSQGLTIAYDDADGGSKGSFYLRRKGTNTWKTAEFFVSDAALSNALGSLQLGTGADHGFNWYISRVEVIKR